MHILLWMNKIENYFVVAVVVVDFFDSIVYYSKAKCIATIKWSICEIHQMPVPKWKRSAYTEKGERELAFALV